MSTVRATNFQNAGSASVNMTLDTAGNATVANTLAMGSSFLRNRIINGDMRIDQRNAGASVTPTGDGSYNIDRWQVSLSQASKFSIQRNAGGVTPPAGFSNYAGITSLSAYSVGASDYFMFNQVIEGFNTSDFSFGSASAASVTLSFWVRSSLTGTFGGALQNGSQTRSYAFTYTISSANTWEQKSVTISGDTTGTWLTDNSAGMIVRFGLGVGSNFSATAGSWVAAQRFSATGSTSVVGTNGATWYITGVQLEAGTVATPFERRQYGQEFALCQRYYEKSYPLGVAPGATGTDGQINFCVNAYTLYAGFLTFQVQKRASPTVTIYNTQTGATGTWYFVANAVSRTVVANRATDRYWEPGGANTWPPGDYTYCNWVASAEL